MLSAFPIDRKSGNSSSKAANVLWGVAAFDFDPTPDVRKGTITQTDADWAYNLRPSIQAERSVPGADEWAIVLSVMHKVNVRLGLISA